MALEPVPNPDKPFNPRPLFPVDLHPREGRFIGDRLSTGAGGDSFYELLLKQYLLRPFTAASLETIFVNVSKAIIGKAAASIGGLRFLGPATLSSREPHKKMEHLSCFAPAVGGLLPALPRLAACRAFLVAWQRACRGFFCLAPPHRERVHRCWACRCWLSTTGARPTRLLLPGRSKKPRPS